MKLLLAAAVAGPGFGLSLLVTTYGFGFRHGIDWDHIAAITDIAGSQDAARRSLLLSTLYALGHALVVLVLGTAAIVAGERLPPGVDTVMERVVGFTLVALGLYVIWALARHRHDFRMRSRWMMVISGARHIVRRVRHGRHPQPARTAADSGENYGPRTAFGVGMLHGVGVETPSQVLVFLAAAGVGGRGAGMLVLATFLAGLLTSNTLIALTSTFGFLRATRTFPIYATVAVVTGVFSVALGVLLALGRGTPLPVLFSG